MTTRRFAWTVLFAALTGMNAHAADKPTIVKEIGGSVVIHSDSGGLKPVAPPSYLPNAQEHRRVPIPANVTMETAYSAFQRGYFLTAFAYATQLATDKADAHAMALIGYIYANGLGMKQNLKEAASWYELAAGKQDPAATVELANLYATGQGVEHNPDKAKALFTQPYVAGRADAEYGLGLIYMDADPSDPNNGKQAYAHLKAASDLKNLDATYALASLYQQGIGVTKDNKQAALWMCEAAKGGHVAAALEYGIMVYNGDGVQADPTIAAKWFERAAVMGNAIAQNRLARLYAAGSGVPKDLSTAAKWHIRAARAGVPDEWLDEQLKDVLGPRPAPAPAAVK